MLLLNIIFVFGMIVMTFGIALPWIISNDTFPVAINIILFMGLSYIYGCLTICYFKRLHAFIKKKLKEKEAKDDGKRTD